MSRRLIREDVRWGMTETFAYAKVYVGIAIAVSLVKLLAGVPVSLTLIPGVIAGYIVCAVFAGGLIGLLRPIAKNLAGYMIVGAAAAVPISLVMFAIAMPREDRASLFLPLALGSAVVLGPIFGAAHWIRHVQGE